MSREELRDMNTKSDGKGLALLAAIALMAILILMTLSRQKREDQPPAPTPTQTKGLQSAVQPGCLTPGQVPTGCLESLDCPEHPGQDSPAL